jgi:glutaconate CoA-transferase subunit B
LGVLVASGRCDVGVIGAAQVDKFGNVNTTGVWEGDIGSTFRPPRTRLTGAGGANDIACGAKRTIIVVTHEPKRFADRVTYVTSPGYLSGGDARKAYDFAGGGPTAIITTLGILRPEPATNEFVLSGWFSFSNVEEIVANTGWALRASPDAGPVPRPTEKELAALRSVDATGALRKKG